MTVFDNGLLELLAGPLAIGVSLLHGRAGDRWPIGPRRWAGKLAAWNVAPPAELADLERQVQAYDRWLTVTTGITIGVAVTALGAILLTLVATGHALRLTNPGLASNALLYPALLVGTGLGYPLAARLWRRSPAGGPRYADLRPRRLADYRWPGLRWLAAIAVAVQAAAAGALLLMGGPAIVALMPLLGAFAFVVGELHMWSAARVARVVVTPDPVTARRCDDLVRAGVIARLQGMEVMTVGFAGVLGLVAGGHLAHAWAPAEQLAILGCIFSLTYCCLVAIGLLGLEERLGGRITGWWGRPMPR